MKPKKYYCPKCGRECTIETRREDFDEKTGKPALSYWANCPAGGWLAALCGHTRNELIAGHNSRNFR